LSVEKEKHTLITIDLIPSPAFSVFTPLSNDFSMLSLLDLDLVSSFLEIVSLDAQAHGSSQGQLTFKEPPSTSLNQKSFHQLLETRSEAKELVRLSAEWKVLIREHTR